MVKKLFIINRIYKIKQMTNLYNTYNDNLAIAQDNERVKGYNLCIYIIINSNFYIFIPPNNNLK